MTLDKLIEELKAMKDGGLPGDTPVVWDAVSHSYDVELKATMRAGKPVVLVNA